MAGEAFKKAMRLKLEDAARANMGKGLTDEQREAIGALADAISEAVAAMTIIPGGIQVQGSPTAQTNAQPITLGEVIL